LTGCDAALANLLDTLFVKIADPIWQAQLYCRQPIALDGILATELFASPRLYQTPAIGYGLITLFGDLRAAQ
jgi:hypothetical protein